MIGGAAPWLLLDNDDMPHVGTIDVDLGLDAEALGDGDYVTLVEALMGNGYKQREELRRFQLVREVPVGDGGAPIDILVDFLMPRHAEIVKNSPSILKDFAVQRGLMDQITLELGKSRENSEARRPDAVVASYWRTTETLGPSMTRS